VPKKLIVTLLSVLSMAGLSALGQQPNPGSPAGDDTETRKRIEAYFRHLYAWGPEVKLAIAPLQETGVPGIRQTTIDLTYGEQKDSARIYVTQDGKHILRGELDDLTKDPLAENRAKLKLDDAPSLGDPKASVVLVEFADFQCPVCRQLHDVLKSILPKYPQARLVFKDFPLAQIHPWAETASVAARCAYMQNPKAFWFFYDHVYADQTLISADNAWDKMVDYASQAGLNPGAFKACMTGPDAPKAIQANLDNGQELEITSTPTLFINGRRMVGADARTVEQYIRFELDEQAHKNGQKK